MGSYDSELGAKKRLRQIEYFKHKSDSVIEPEYINDPPDNVEVEIKVSRLKKLSLLYKIAEECGCKIESYDTSYDEDGVWSH